MKSLAPKKPAKHEREQKVLFGLIELYLKEGKPVGSNTLRENGFEALSSATIRNYFAQLEEEGLVKQQHSSGGRIPTAAAYRLYANAHKQMPLLTSDERKQITAAFKSQTREVASYLLQATDKMSQCTQCAVFMSAPRFDQDFILEIKVMMVDATRLLCVMITDFGLVRTEILHAPQKLSSFAVKRFESYFNWRLTGLEKPKMSEEEEAQAQALYKEILLRHIVSYTHFSSEDLLLAGFSQLLAYPDFNEAAALASGLALFENKQVLRTLLAQAAQQDKMLCWIGEDLIPFSKEAAACSVIAVPYRINQTVCGALGILGPTRLPYREQFGRLQAISEAISASLTQSVYKFKLSFRTPQPSHLGWQKQETSGLDTSHALLLEDQSLKETP